MDYNISKQIRELVEYLNARTKEYDEGHPTISDKEWDDKYFQLKKLENTYHILFNNSPTQVINYEVVNSLNKVEHNHKMLSLDKTKSYDEVITFLNHQKALAMSKMDGLTCSLTFINGVLISAETRGNGSIGEDIIHNAKVIRSIPKEIPNAKRIVIDGEIICTESDFKDFSSEYKNPRNFASGSIRLLDSAECAKRNLTFVAWDVIEGFNEEKTLYEKLQKLSSYGFIVVPFIAVNEGITVEGLKNIENEIVNKSKDLGYPIDGIVYKFNNIAYGKALGKTAHHFKNAIAYKFYDENYSTILRNVEWTMGRTGVLTPIAVFDPVEIEGSVVSRASLHNISIMKETLGYPYEGQNISVFKSNMIIPQISYGEKIEENLEGYNYITLPKICPICKESLIIKKDNNSEFLYCSNTSCEGKFINQLDHFCGKKGLDIKGLSLATLKKLIDWNWVNNYTDLFNLETHSVEWKKKDGFGKKSVENILDAIKKSSTCELDKFICALGVPLIGSSASKELIKHFSTWPDFINAVETKYNFWELPNFGTEMHNAIINFDYSQAKELYDNYITIKNPEEKKELTNNLDGLSIVITGKLTKFKNRDELKSLIENNGGKVVGSISSKTSYLINNDINSTSSKNLSAKKFGIPILSEEDFIETFKIL